MFLRKEVLENFAIFTGIHLCWSLFLLKLQVFWSSGLQFSCEYWIFLAASVVCISNVKIIKPRGESFEANNYEETFVNRWNYVHCNWNYLILVMFSSNFIIFNSQLWAANRISKNIFLISNTWHFCHTCHIC